MISLCFVKSVSALLFSSSLFLSLSLLFYSRINSKSFSHAGSRLSRGKVGLSSHSKTDRMLAEKWQRTFGDTFFQKRCNCYEESNRVDIKKLNV